MQKNSEKKSHEYWASLIAEQEKSGVSQKAFCIQRGLVVSQFVYYRCSFKNKRKPIQAVEQAFRPVKVAIKEPSSVSGDIKISLPNGFQCLFSCSLESSQIKRLVEVLLSC